MSMSELFNLENEPAVGIGGTGVLGGAMAEALAGAGARVAVVGRSIERGEERAISIRSAGGTALFCAADVMDRGSLLSVRDRVQSEFGPVSVLVNAAGGNRRMQHCHRVQTFANCRSKRGREFST